MRPHPPRGPPRPSPEEAVLGPELAGGECVLGSCFSCFWAPWALAPPWVSAGKGRRGREAAAARRQVWSAGGLVGPAASSPCGRAHSLGLSRCWWCVRVFWRQQEDVRPPRRGFSPKMQRNIPDDWVVVSGRRPGARSPVLCGLSGCSGWGKSRGERSLSSWWLGFPVCPPTGCPAAC